MRPTRLVSIAAKMVEKYGTKCDVTTVVAPGTYDPLTQKRGEPVVSLTSTKALPEVIKGQFFRSNLVQAGDVKLILPGAAFVIPPVPGSKIAYNKQVYTIAPGDSVETYTFGDKVVLYEVQARF